MAQNATDLANAQQNLLTLRSQGAAGKDFQGAIGPDGKLNTALLNQSLANDPVAARSAIAASQAGQSNAATSISNAGQQQQQAFQRFTAVGNSLGSLLQSGKPIGQKDVQNVVADLVANPAHPMDAKEGADLIGQASMMNADQLHQAIAARYAFAQQSAASLAPAVGMVNNGAANVPINTNAAAGSIGPIAGATPVPNQLGPSQLATQVPIINAQGQPTVQNLGNVLHMQNGGGAVPSVDELTAQATQMANQGGPGANAPAAQAWLQQQLAAQGRNPQPVLAPGASSGGVPTGLAPGVAEAATAAGRQAGEGGAALTNDMAALPQTRAALQQVASEISGANPGPLNDQLTKLGGILTQLGVSNEQATSSQLMHKASMLATLSTVSSNLGVPTDGKMSAVMAATPNATMTPEAARAATGMLQGLVDYKQAKGEAWQQYQASNGPQSFGQFQTQWNNKVPNAAAFQFNHLPAAEQSKYWSSLDKGSKQQLLDSMQAVGIQPVKNGK
ncbi:hypothetical protein EAH75_01485 [Rhodanobacter glycinis]|uniref:hypothetical protein n=1 Tax=Rhodanobacter glycinis TaxID=582702 RepID=UPI00112609C1|nr:hypothetical protein [Rhodanobacter glycinis]TPG50195.1 hypothetical protein EAH75_01485 [Rhodanobacter glycinis]